MTNSDRIHGEQMQLRLGLRLRRLAVQLRKHASPNRRTHAFLAHHGASRRASKLRPARWWHVSRVRRFSTIFAVARNDLRAHHGVVERPHARPGAAIPLELRDLAGARDAAVMNASRSGARSMRTLDGSSRVMQISIREEQPEDVAAIRRVNEKAFGQPQEARLIELLRANSGVLLSLVAAVDGRVVGHVLYSPVRLGSGPNEVHGAGLGPMAVLPEFQRMGVGSKLEAFMLLPLDASKLSAAPRVASYREEFSTVI
jgi:GNAT superfamily N-acetyltransferase